MLKKLSIFIFLLAGFAWSFSASAATCPMDNGAGVGCNAGNNEYYCGNACRQLSAGTTPTLNFCQNNFQVCAPGVDCTNSYAAAFPCGVPQACNGGFTLCNVAGTGASSFPDSKCKANAGIPAGCSSYNQCTNVCSACSAGYELLAGNCIGATVRLGTDSVMSDRLINSTMPLMSILSSGYVGIGITDPNDVFSIGNSGSAPLGSVNTGHNYTSTYLSADNYALTNYGLVKTLIASATSSSALFGGTIGGNIWNLNTGNVGIGTTDPLEKLQVAAGNIFVSKTYGQIIFGNQEGDGDVHFGSSGKGAPLNGLQDYGFYAAHNAYRGEDGNWYHSRTTSIPAVRFTGGGGVSSGTAGFRWDYSANNGVSPISWTNLMVLTTAGNVGIGTTNPGAKLEVAGAIKLNSGAVSDTIYASNTNGIILESQGNYYGAVRLILQNIGGSNGALFQNTGVDLVDFGFRGSSNAQQNIRFEHRGGSVYPGNSAGQFEIGPADVENFFVGAGVSGFLNGNVGIGTTAPNDKLSIGNSGTAPVGSLATGHNYTMTYLSTDQYALINYGTVMTLLNAATSSSALWNGTKNGNIWNGDAGVGNVGIGTTNPSGLLSLTKFLALGDNKEMFSVGHDASYNLKLFQNFSASGVMQYDWIQKVAGVDKNVLTFKQGNVGIGTTNPLVLLDINAGSAGTSVIKFTASSGVNVAQLGFVAGYGAVVGATSGNSMYIHGTSIKFVSQDLATEWMRIQNNGNVGIGTTTPLWPLVVGATPAFSVDSATGRVAVGGALPAVGSNGYNLQVYGNQGIFTAAGFRVDRTDKYAMYAPFGGMYLGGAVDNYIAGNLGIGTTIPNDKLSIGNSGSAPLGSVNTGHNYTMTYLSSDPYALINYGTVLTLLNAATTTNALWNGTKNGDIYNGDAGVGNVGIGTTTPSQKLVVQGNILVQSGTLPLAKIWDNGSGGSFGVYDGAGNQSIQFFGNILRNNTGTLAFQYGSTKDISMFGDTGNPIFFKQSSGNVGIGTTNPTYLLHVRGNLNGTGSTSVRFDGGTNVAAGGLTFSSFYDAVNTNTRLAGIQSTDRDGNMKSLLLNAGGGNVGIGTTIPNDKLSIGNAGSAPVGSLATGHNYTMTYLSTDPYALINYGTVMTLLNAATSSIVTQPVFATSTVTTYIGSQGGSYTGVNALCSAVVSGSHVCTTGEIFNTINSGHTTDIPISTLWINNGPPGYTANANDCMGWSSAVGTNYGTVWIKTASGDGFGSLQACNNARKYACCK